MRALPLSPPGAMASAGWADLEFARSFVFGFKVVEDIPGSGLFHPCERPATVPMTEFTPANNRVWNDSAVRQVAAAASSPGPDTAEMTRLLWERTRTEACKGYIKGPFKRARMSSMLGKNGYRAMVRFGVLQARASRRS